VDDAESSVWVRGDFGHAVFQANLHDPVVMADIADPFAVKVQLFFQRLVLLSNVF
jgi:hypothetical protein